MKLKKKKKKEKQHINHIEEHIREQHEETLINTEEQHKKQHKEQTEVNTEEQNKKEDNNVFKIIKTRLDKIIKSDTQINTNEFNYTKNDILNSINDVVYKVNVILYHTHNFLKLYILYLYQNKTEFPNIDRAFLLLIMSYIVSKRKKIFCSDKKMSHNNFEIFTNLKQFYNEHYKPLINENELVYSDNLSFTLSYEADNIITCIKNNIKEHFLDHLRKYIRILFNYRTKLENKTEDNLMKKKIYYFYSDVISKNSEYQSEKIYHNLINKIKNKFLPQDRKFLKNSIPYDIEAKPLNYLKYFIDINVSFEKRNNKNSQFQNCNTLFIDTTLEYFEIFNKYIDKEKSIDILKTHNINNDSEIKLFNILPLKRSLIPSHITIDTSQIISILFKKNKLEYFNNVQKYKNYIWSQFFKTDTRIFRKNKFEFTGLIKTDGYSVSITFGYYDKTISKFKKDKKQTEDYIESHTNINNIFKNKNYVLIDPNKEDLMYCMNNNGQKFRYTNSQRKYETETKRFNIYFDKLKKNTNINSSDIDSTEILNYIAINKITAKTEYDNELFKKLKYIIIEYYKNIRQRDKSIIDIKNILLSKKEKSKIFEEISNYVEITKSEIKDFLIIKKIIKKYNNKITNLENLTSIKTIESVLSNNNSKTNNIDKFKDYIRTKEKVNNIIRYFYRETKHRKRKLNTYSNKQRSEINMVKNFRNKFGEPEKTLVVMGDYSEGNKYIKGREPTINIRLRSLLRKASYNVYMIDEYKTSKLCNHCGEIVKNKYKRKNETKAVWGLVCCSNKNCVQDLNSKTNTNYKKRYMNRDTNSVLNMQKILNNLLKTNTRPIEYIRTYRCILPYTTV
jgi:hypothetical protein